MYINLCIFFNSFQAYVLILFVVWEHTFSVIGVLIGLSVDTFLQQTYLWHVLNDFKLYHLRE